MSEYLFDKFQQVLKKIKDAEKLLLFLDYDGTLVHFKNRPEEVKTSKKVELIISQLIELNNIQVVVITGRRLSEIQELLKLDGLSYAALHGLQIKLANGKCYDEIIDESTQKILRKIKDDIKAHLSDEKGLFLEDKDLTFAIHYRMISDNKTQDILEKILYLIKSIDIENKLDILHGSKVIELRPKGWNKGKAVELIRSNNNLKNALPIYIGDDATDEDAFYYIKNNGITIHVSNQSDLKTSAQYWLEDPDDVLEFLNRLRAF